VDANRTGITIFSYRAPTVLISAETENGELPFDDIDVNVEFTSRGFSYGEGVIRQADGRFRTKSLMPDQEYQLSAHVRGYVPSLVRRVTLPGGASTELTLFLRKTPPPLRDGDTAPSFTVKTSDGEVVNLADFRGRLLLLHFWHPLFPPSLKELEAVHAVYDSFGKDNRLATLGLCMRADPDGAANEFRKHHLTWPQAVLRDGGLDPMALDYGVQTFRTVLVGPDGKIIAGSLQGPGIAEAVGRALRPN
jgi:peroxiredoxin